MIDIKRIRENPDEIKKALAARRSDIDLDPFFEMDRERRALISDVESRRARQKADSQQIPQMKKKGEDTTALMAEMKELSDAIKVDDEKLRELEEKCEAFLLMLPNPPHSSVPDGPDDSANVEIRRWGEPTKFDFEPKAHWDLGSELGILDPDTAAKVTGSRFTFYRGAGSRLERSIFNFFLDTHVFESGYEEIFPPYMVHRRSMIGTGQLPKFEEEAFKVAGTEYFMIPTAEVPVTNMYREMILENVNFPIKHCAYSACFRAEAGSAGRDTRGLVRQHQFNKVELVRIAHPDHSYEDLEELTHDAEKVLQKLGLPYRVVLLSTGDMGFSSAKTYDIEVWMPSYGRYVEISSCSNCEDFQARRAGIRFRDESGKTRFCHTLNGSGVAVGRTVAAVLENYQTADGHVKVPEALVPYMRVEAI